MAHFRELALPHDVHARAAAELVFTHVAGSFSDAADPVETYVSIVNRMQTFCLEEEETLLGVGSLLMVQDVGVAELHNVAVDPAYRGKGYARELIHTIEDRARQSGCMLMRAYSLAEAVGFYQKLGYRTLPQTDDPYNLAKQLV